ncbi:hypothetical protein BJY01DRAFT_241740 [Aspergillus pseudoustus]|uniref:FAD/NAD(P)-binding domain-containing protein n=1 Tax=Aspergillus pseudoustus TaxID=1810923 RepID=A0ABR4I8G8_9EURO
MGNSKETLLLEVDVAIIGAGISRIKTAYHLQTKGPRGLSYAILENRSNLSGTWDLSRYPGIRSDSDILTFEFTLRWTLNVTSNNGDSDFDDEKKVRKVVHCRFIVMGAGYYNYEEPLEANIPALESFMGMVVHPQFWPGNMSYMDKEMVIIGSGATAVNLLPSVTDRVKHVTLLQQIPTYILPLPIQDQLSRVLRTLLPASTAGRINGLRFAIASFFLVFYCRMFPNAARRNFTKTITNQLPPNVKVDPHFKPRYNPREQRLCATPDGDFSLRSDQARPPIQLQSGDTLRTDIIVITAGLKLIFAGGINLSVNRVVPIDISQKFVWRGTMIVRELHQMKRKGAVSAVPRLEKPEVMEQRPLFNISSTYIRNTSQVFPKGGVRQWGQNKNYLLDILRAS